MLQQNATKLENENTELKEKIEETRTNKSETVDIDVSNLLTENQNLKECLEYAENMLLQEEPSNIVLTTNPEKTVYSTQTSLCVMNLLSEGVGVHHVTNVMTHVADMCGKTFSQLPSVSTINRIGDQRVSLSYKHISEELSTQKDTKLQSDETRKHGEVYKVYSIRDEDERNGY
ncbi:hypothetical protein DPMN_111058 [Dreissena polymorpha]|uniref:Uncharacterized protein n=1 Tax=Dreissena polymorpha TaxID=45954 RepID=A0A9D4KE46_DREPO|nr:hypothetical protein DPMN_111058 [Dreissena polymorpha]